MAMSSITIYFQNVTLTSTVTAITVTDGNFDFDISSALSMSGTISFNALYITSGAVNFNVASGTNFDAQITIPINAPSGAPTIEITNFSGNVTVTWPTPSGPQTQVVMSSDPLTLNAFVS